MFENSIADADEMAIFLFLEFTVEIIRIGCMEEWSSKELTEFVQLMIAWVIRGSQRDSCVSTWQIRAMSRGCFTSYRLVWDPGNFTTYRLIQDRFTWGGFTNDVLRVFLENS